MSEKDYKRLYLGNTLTRVFIRFLLAGTLLFLLWSETFGRGKWWRVLFWIWVGAVIALAIGSVYFWRCPKCRRRLPGYGRDGDLDLFTRQSPYSNDRSLPYRCPGCGVEIDLVAVVHPESRPPRC